MSSNPRQPTPEPTDEAATDFPPIGAMSNADLLGAVAESVAGARNYYGGGGPTTDDHIIVTGDVIDALDNLLVVVRRLAEEREA